MRFLLIVGHPQSFFLNTLQLCPTTLKAPHIKKIISHFLVIILLVVFLLIYYASLLEVYLFLTVRISKLS